MEEAGGRGGEADDDTHAPRGLAHRRPGKKKEPDGARLFPHDRSADQVEAG
jgi:hypothetical protein